MIICFSCYTECPDEANYCLHCGTYLKLNKELNNQTSAGKESLLSNETMTQALRRLMPTSYVEKLLATKGQVEGERRVVTILFSDIKGSTSLAENLDPEEVLEIMNGAFDVLIEPIARYEGTLARLMGDAILAFFGAPIAHEDDPYRACRAALDILHGAEKFSQKLENEKGIKGFSVRVGINTGLVVVAEVGADLRVEYTAMGDAVNVAARMESAAEPGSILITESTKRLITNDFKVSRIGSIQVKGKTKPIESFKVIGILEKNEKIEAIDKNISIIGRKLELQKIRNTIGKLKQGKGNIISIIGDQGIGKTRLVSESHKLLSSSVKWAEGRALSYTQKNSYWIARNVLKDYLGITQETSEETIPGALRNLLKSKTEEEFLEIYPFLLHFLNIPLEDKYLESITLKNSETLKGQIHYAIKSFIKEESVKQPLVLVWEDLHWSDSPSLHLLNELFPLTEEFPILLLLVYRINETEGEIWNFHYNNLQAYNERFEVIKLNVLEPKECTIIINKILGEQKISEELENRIINRTEGNPFFLIELMRSLTDRGIINFENEAAPSVTTMEEFQVPDLLHSIIMTRIDSLATSEKLMLQTASAIGRVFQKRLLARIMEKKMSDLDFEKSLKELQVREFVLRHLPTNVGDKKLNFEKEYIIKDSLVYDVVYSTLLLSQREKLHKEIGETIESLITNYDTNFVEILADHFEKGKVWDKALYYNRKAADKAKNIFANEEAIYYYTRTLSFANEEKTDSIELAKIYESLGEVYSLIAKYSMAIDNYNQSLRYYSEPFANSRVCYKCGQVYERWGKYDESLELFNNGLKMLEDAKESLHSAIIYAGMGMVYYRQGDYLKANSLSLHALQILEKEGNESDIADTYNNLGIIQCKMGDLVKSFDYHKKCLDIRENIGHLTGLAASNNNLGYLYQLQNNLDTAIEYYSQSIRLCEKIGNLHGLAMTYNNLSQLYNDKGNEELAIDYNLKAITIFAEIAKDGLEMNTAVLRQSGVW